MKGIFVALGVVLVLAASAAIAFWPTGNEPPANAQIPMTDPPKTSDKLEVATLGGGCFWCTEAVFLQLTGVKSVKSGYGGGWKANPTYEEVCDETTGHAEVIQVQFDPTALKFKDLLEVFFHTHDPTTRDRQGNDVGRRYRSTIFYHTASQKKTAEEAIAALDNSKLYPRPIVTEVEAFKNFYPAENYHQNYFAKNPTAGYCQVVIRPKLEKLHAVFRDKVK
jgi:peptide-methionine (S)-S-oxide reductase